MENECVCPHCRAKMEKIRTPWESTWGGEMHFVCFNDECDYYVKSWTAMESQGIENAGYRCRIDPRGCCGPLVVWSKDALRDLIVCEEDKPRAKGTLDYFTAADFAREDETPDEVYYKNAPPIETVDSLALSTIQEVYSRLIRKGSRILDLMAGSDSHLTEELEPNAVVGLGLSTKELAENPALTESVLHDLNADPELPFKNKEFDVVINTLSVQYMTRPVEVFREAARILKPRGLFIVVFSNRMFPPKAVSIWKKYSQPERVDLVKKLFSAADQLSIMGDFESTGKPRPKDDKYYMLGIPSDPIYAVWAVCAT